MSWIKRNLYFLIGALVTVGLMALAGFYLYQETRHNNEARENLNKGYVELERLYTQKPNPGNEKVDNTKEAKKQQEELRALLGRVTRHFERIPAIPDTPKVTGEDFTALLRRTIDQLQRDAAQASVALPPRYDFTFQAIKPRVTFAPGSLESLATQLGEVKAICDILFRAKVNALESLRRERVSSDDDPQAAAADYLEWQSVTNDLAVLRPYEISFRCFSSELGAVLDGFRKSRHGFIVKMINVEPAPVLVTTEQPAGITYAPPMATPAPPVAPEAVRRYTGFRDEGPEPVRAATPTLPPVAVPTTPAVTPGAGVLSGRGGLPIVINEKLLRVSLLVDLAKLSPQPHPTSRQ